jgi:ABC-type nitrate/sulfonate/bicarbonate transport system permease component
MTTAAQIDVRPRRRHRPVWSGRLAAIGWPALLVGTIVLAWELWVRLDDVPLYLMPRPLAVFEACFHDFLHFTGDIRTTVTEIAAGFLVSVAIGIPVAFALDASEALEGAAYPFLVASQVLPVIALAPVIVNWFGYGLTPKVVIIVIFNLFVIVLNTLQGLRSFKLHSRSARRA